jgi:hypothetical protein
MATCTEGGIPGARLRQLDDAVPQPQVEPVPR